MSWLVQMVNTMMPSKEQLLYMVSAGECFQLDPEKRTVFV